MRLPTRASARLGVVLKKPWSTRSRVYVVGVLVLPLIAGIAGALSVHNPVEHGDDVVLSAFLAALWAFAAFVVLFNVVELVNRFRRKPPSQTPQDGGTP